MPTLATTTALKQIYNFKGNFNAAALQILANAGYSNTAGERGAQSLPTPYRIETTFNLGEATNQQSIGGPVYQGAMVYDFWEGSLLTFRISTSRPDEQPSPEPGVATMHDDFLATVYTVFEERQAPFSQIIAPSTTPILQYYDVVKILPRATRSGLDPMFMEDWTEIPFEIWFGIRSNVWPQA